MRWATERNQDVTAGGAVDLYPDRAVVDIEERAIRAKGVEPQVVFGQRLDDLVDVALALVKPLRQRTDILDHALQRPARPLEHVGEVALGRRKRWDRARDRVTAPREPGDPLLQLIDAAVALLTLPL